MLPLRNNKGSLTVEAAFLIPFITLVMIAVITLGSRFYNRIVLETAVDRAISECEDIRREQGGITEERMASVLSEKLRGFTGGGSCSSSITHDSGGYTVEVIYTPNVAVSSLAGRVFGAAGRIVYSKRTERFEREDVYRVISEGESIWQR